MLNRSNVFTLQSLNIVVLFSLIHVPIASNKSETTVTFWTEDFPELICVARFNKDDKGNIFYELDFSESTL